MIKYLMWLNGLPWLLTDNLWPKWKPAEAPQQQVSLVEVEKLLKQRHIVAPIQQTRAFMYFRCFSIP